MGSLRAKSAHKLRTWFTNFHKSTEQQTVPLNCSHLLAIGGSSHSYLVPHLVSACHLNTNCCVVLPNILVSLFQYFSDTANFLLSLSGSLSAVKVSLLLLNVSNTTTHARTQHLPSLCLSLFFHVANDKFSGKAQQVLTFLPFSGSFQDLLILNECDISLEYPLHPISNIS